MLLEVRDLRVHFSLEDGLIRAVDGVSFGLEKGRTLGIVGESGCGKSVTALSLLRLFPTPPARIVSGEVLFEGKDLLKLDLGGIRAVRGRDIGMIFQDPMTSLNPVFPVGTQIVEALETHRPEMSAAAMRDRALDLLRWVGLPEPEHHLDDFPHRLSGGMRQRVMIAMALACEPKLLVADEPTTALDVTIQAQILELLRRLQRELGMSLLLITHDLGVVAETCDEVLVMYAGKPAERASRDDLFREPRHPYTRGLLGSLPHGGSRGRRLNAIPGTVPLRPPDGCRFRDRCPIAKPHCAENEPPLEEKRPGHWVSCFEVA